jgi:hypothetical protein
VSGEEQELRALRIISEHKREELRKAGENCTMRELHNLYCSEYY